jgi:LDH2 family malate/lactate/ureidoglycolate dehydrogenase
MSSPQPQTVRVRETVLKAFCTAVLQRLGVAADEAALVTEVLVEADLRGVESHGVLRLPQYVERITAGGANPKPNIRPVRETRTTAVLDGDNGLGHLVGVRAMELAMAKAAEGDCAFVAVRNSNHYGAAAYFAEMAARRDMIGLSFTISGLLLFPPWGGTEAMIGNNPLAVAFPTDRGFPIVLDMACTVARGKILAASKKGVSIPADWATGPDGLPTTDPTEALKGLLLPVGGPKGYALAVTVGLLSTMLSGAAFGSEIGQVHWQTDTAANVGHLFGVIPISSFEDIARYKQRIGKAIEDIQNVKKAPGVERIFLPGEREYLLMQERRQQGIPLSLGVFKDLRQMGDRFGLELATIGSSCGRSKPVMA